MATKGQLINSVLTEVGRLDKAAAAEEWFDEIYQALLTAHDWSFITTRATRPTAVGLYRVALPLDFRKMYALYLDTGTSSAQKLSPLGLAEFTRRFPRPESLAAGKPSAYATYNNNLLLAPKCDSAADSLALIYTYNPPNITSNETPVVPERMYNALKAGMRGLFYGNIKEFEKAEKQMGMYSKMVDLYMADDVDASDDAIVLRPFENSNIIVPGEYWNNPLIKSMP